MTKQKRVGPYGRCGLLGAEPAREGAGRRSGSGARMRGEGAGPGRGCARCSERRRWQDLGCAGTAGSGLGWTPRAGDWRPENKSLPVFGTRQQPAGRKPGCAARRPGLSKCPGWGAPGRWAEQGRAGSGGAGLCGAGWAAGRRRHWGPGRVAAAVVMAVAQPSGSLAASLERGPRLAVPLRRASRGAVRCYTQRPLGASLPDPIGIRH